MKKISSRFTTGIVDEPKQVRLPITGYTNERLLTLEETCAPLTTIVSHLESHIWVAKQNSRNPQDGLTQDESAAIRLYTMEWGQGASSLYYLLNQTLKATDRTQLRPWFKYLKLFITALAKLPFAPRQSVWRGVTRDLSAEFPVGNEMIWWSFSSCTTSLSVLESDVYLGRIGARTLFSIDAINGKFIRKHSHFDTEDEILLLPGTVLEVQSQLNPAPDLYIIHLKQKHPITMLLEPPFEGALLYPDDDRTNRTPWFKRRNVIAYTTGLISVITLAIIFAFVFGYRDSHTTSSFVTIFSSNNVSVAICQPRRPKNISADMFWSFDCSNSANDLSNTSSYDGVGVNNVSYIIPDFSGQTPYAALALVSTSKQYVNIPYYWNFALTSFTITAWIYPTAVLNDRAPIFANWYWGDPQLPRLVCQISTNLTLEFIFGRNYILSNRSITLSQWQHVSFVFDNQSLTSSIYLDGYLIGKNNGGSTITNYTIHPSSTIGYNLYDQSALGLDESYYTGYIDQLSFTFRAKSSTELLNEATLIFAYQFINQGELFEDLGPNAINGTGQNVFSNGSNELIFNTTASYFQSSDFTLLFSQNYSYSIAFWIEPSVDYTATGDRGGYLAPLVRLSSMTTSSNGVQGDEKCVSILALSQGQLMLTANLPSSSLYFTTYNLTLQSNEKYHITFTYSLSTKKFQLYCNGQLFNSSSDTQYDSPLMQLNGGIPRMKLTLGGPSSPKNPEQQYQWFSTMCNWGGQYALQNGLYFIEFNGTMSDVRMYSRVLTQSDIDTLIAI